MADLEDRAAQLAPPRSTAEGQCAVSNDDPPLEALGVTIRELAFAAWRAGRGATDPAKPSFSRWWLHEAAELEARRGRGSLRLLCQAAYRAAWPRASEYEPGDGFTAWWQRITDECRLALEGVATA